MSAITMWERFDIAGIACATCAATAVRALRSIPGVKTAQVGILSGEARVEFDPGRTSRSALAAALRHAGFVVLTDVASSRSPAERPVTEPALRPRRQARRDAPSRTGRAWQWLRALPT